MASLQGCLQSLAHAVPGHKVSCVPGLHELTLKDRLIARLTQFYGEGAFDIIPRSYLLPTQYWPWRLWLANQVFLNSIFLLVIQWPLLLSNLDTACSGSKRWSTEEYIPHPEG